MFIFKRRFSHLVWLTLFVVFIGGCGGEEPAIEGVSTKSSSNQPTEPNSLIGKSIENFPHENLVNQEDKPVSIQKLPDKPIMISFIYTRCPVQSMCPRVTDQMAKIQDRVNKQGKKPVHFILVTFDPKYDRPDVLKEYAKKYQIDFDNFSLWTGPIKSVDQFIESFKIMVIRDGNKVKTHNMRTYLIDRERVIRHQFRRSDWTVDDVMQPLWEMI